MDKEKRKDKKQKKIVYPQTTLTFVDGQSDTVRHSGIDGLQTLLDEEEQLTCMLVVHLTQRPLLVAEHRLVQRLPAAGQSVT